MECLAMVGDRNSLAAIYRIKGVKEETVCHCARSPCYQHLTGRPPVSVTLEYFPERHLVEMETSDGQHQPFLRFAALHFTLHGTSHRLIAYRSLHEQGETTLFIPFCDALTGKETYGAGRYLDVPFHEGNTTLVLDFNTAYNPYCAYSDGYCCPLPPAENRLSCAIRAGERNAHESVLEENKRMRLDIYIGEHCENCQEALSFAEVVRQIEGVEVRVIDWDDPRQAIPSKVFAVPTYVLNDQVVSLGNPERSAFLHHLRWLCQEGVS